MNPNKYLVSGSWGKLGSQIRDSIQCVTPTESEMNILDVHQIRHYLESDSFDAILHLAAISDQRFAAKERLLSYQVNIIGTRNMAEMTQEYGLKIYYISTDYVFPCTEGNYKETDSPYPANWYGFTKYAGELEIQNATNSFCIIRTSFRPTSWEFPTAYSNVYTSADYVDVIAQQIILCLNYNVNGIIHIGSPTKSLYELAKIRNPNTIPEECNDESFPKRRDLNIDKWLSIKKGGPVHERQE